MTPLGRAGRNDECAGFVSSGNQFKGPCRLRLCLLQPDTERMGAALPAPIREESSLKSMAWQRRRLVPGVEPLG